MTNLELGIKKGEQRDYAGAILDYDAAIQAEPRQQEAYYRRAGAKTHLKRYQEAISDYSKAL